jgi:hypothetical protein
LRFVAIEVGPLLVPERYTDTKRAWPRIRGTYDGA